MKWIHTFISLTTLVANARDTSFVAYEYNTISSGNVSLGCAIADLRKTQFKTQEKFFKRMAYCLSRNPHMDITARASLKLLPRNCPKNQRLVFELPKELEDYWEIPAREKLVFSGIDNDSDELISVGLTDNSSPCAARTMSMYSSEIKTLKDLTLPAVPLNKPYLIIDGLRMETKRSVESLSTKIVLNMPQAVADSKDGMYYCQAGCCGQSSKCRNVELRSINEPITLLRRANACIRRFSAHCGITARQRMRWDFDIEDIFLCDNNAIALDLNFTASQFTVHTGNTLDLGLVPVPEPDASGTITFSQSRTACGKDAKPWFDAGYNSTTNSWVISRVYDLSFSKPFLTISSEDFQVYDTYYLGLPLTFRSTVPDTEVQHTEFFGM